MLTFISVFFLSTFLVVIFDYIWLGLIMKKFYVEALAPFGRVIDGSISMNIWPAILVYILLGLGLTFFVILPTSTLPILRTILTAIIFGVVVYGVYDLTNLATLKDWTSSIVIADIIWGAVISVLVAVITKLIIF
ncbi:MAG: DUF2177 family protein [Candidatus Pacebacteria bacterium]|jgi:uncharacterized membrane protein|nr:DUF2177 family protein [Candidatus Paceibacterota bacterium]MBP9058200.1 DUF2177 family protein [Candidatus Paceibacterota bacterium]MBP9770325.1 DUF2177 family protein [Candidatus Paceibacterota bacterium]